MAMDLHVVTVKPRVAEVAAWDAAARRAGLTRHAWIRSILNAEADYGGRDELLARAQKPDNGGSST